MAKKSTSATDRVKRNLAALERIKAASKELAAPAKPPSKTAPQFVLRYSPEMRDKIARLAKANGMSINSQLIVLLERALNHGDAVEQLQGSMGEIFDRMEKLESVVCEHDDLLSRRDPYNDEK